MLLVKSFLFETNKQISLGFAASIFLHVAVVSFFLIDNGPSKKIEADLLAAQSIPIQIVSSVQSTRNVIQKKKTAPAKPKEVVKKTAVKPQKIEPKKKVTQKTVSPQTQTSSAQSNSEPTEAREGEANNAQSAPIPVVSGASLVGRRVQPTYPKRALRLKQEGTVFIQVLISETGKRQDIKISRPSKHALLNQAAIKAVKKWTFDPNMVNGRAVKSWVEIPVEFKIQ